MLAPLIVAIPQITGIPKADANWYVDTFDLIINASFFASKLESSRLHLMVPLHSKEDLHPQIAILEALGEDMG